MLQELLLEKDEGASRVHEAVEQGEKLFPNTAAQGRDIIRQEIRYITDKSYRNVQRTS